MVEVFLWVMQFRFGSHYYKFTDIITKFANSHEKRLRDHINIEAVQASQCEQYHQMIQREETVWTS
jgi:hypothetical protein